MRINDIVTESENQLGPLEMQAEKAKIFLDLREKLKYLEIGLFINGIEKNKIKLDEIKLSLENMAEELSDEENNLSDMQSKKEKHQESISLGTNVSAWCMAIRAQFIKDLRQERKQSSF